MESAQLRNNRLYVTPALDPLHPQYALKHSSKTFYHFSLRASQRIDLSVAISRMKILDYFASVWVGRCRESNSRSTTGQS